MTAFDDRTFHVLKMILNIQSRKLFTFVILSLIVPSVLDSLFVTSTWYNLHETEMFNGTKCRRKRILGES